MSIGSVVKQSLYKDSVALMRIAQIVVERARVRRATLLMGTAGNKDILAQAGLLDPAVKDARPSDIMVVIEADSTDAIAAALREVDALIEGREPRQEGSRTEQAAPRSIAMAVAETGGANLAQISVPGPYAAAEALKALRRGLNVFLFSDNVPVWQERQLKELALQKHLLVMGPDCGTAIIRGVPLGFANVVRRGSIGLVGASGTGLQEVTCRIHQLGGGITHAIGTGSHDILDDIGAITMRQGLDLLAADDGTKVIVIVSKPPSKGVQQRVLDRVATIAKPVVVCFLGSDAAAMRSAPHVHPVSTLLEAAELAVALGRGESGQAGRVPQAQPADTAGRRSGAPRGWIRGLFSGGSFCSEAQFIWRQHGIAAYSNAPLDASRRLADGRTSREHAAIDMGSDEFTVGRPHPMIDYGPRVERLLQEAGDPEVAVVLLDVVLGYGSHEDPGGALAPAIAEARAKAARDGRRLAIIAFVCGTEDDPQRLSVQQEKLRAAGAELAQSSTEAARLAAVIAFGGEASGERSRSAAASERSR